ncbi:MAG: PorT family protein [Bryobacterales bacterium]|nr:PorT family protein [Bryobacterales bacterium]
MIRNTISVSLLALSLGAAALSAQTATQEPSQAPAPPVVTPAPAASAADKPLVPLAAAQSPAYVRRFSGGLTASFTPWDLMKGGDFSGVVFPGPRDVISQAGPNSKWYAAGVAIQVTVTNRFAVAVNAIVRQAGFAMSSNVIEGVDLPNTATDERKYFIETEDTHAYYMDLPLLVRYYGKSHRKEGKRWFVEAGGTMRHVWNVKTSITTETIDGVTCCTNTPTRPHKQNALGATVGAGMHFADDFGIRIIPEVRYTRWLNETFQKYGAHSRRDQVEIMITIGF